MMRDNQAVEYAFSLLAAIAVFIALNGIVYRGILYPVLSHARSRETGLSYSDVCTRPAHFSDHQFEIHVRQFVGRSISGWQGWIRWQTPQDNAILSIGLASDPPGDLTWGRDIELIGIPAAIAEGFRWGQQVTFSGTIRHVKIWGVICQPMIEGVVFSQ